MTTIDSASQKWSTPRYRSVGPGSSVDESLFGNTGDSNGVSFKAERMKRRTVKAPIPPSAVVISAHELLRIQNESVIKSEAEIRADRERARLAQEERAAKARERVARMKELEKKAALLAKKSDSEVAEAARKQAIRDMAEAQIDLNSDVVKMLSSMAQRAIAFTIRDHQLEEKERRLEQEKAIEKRTDIMIEIDRIHDISRREQEELSKKTKRVEDRSVINDQIAERNRQRLLEFESREQENLQMRAVMSRYQEEDEKKAKEREIAIVASREEVKRANEAAIERKKALKMRERKEVEDILLYQAMKDAELAKREEEEAAIERGKKERQAKLLAEQERVQSNLGKLDELRARRAAEEKEREARTRERQEALKRKAEMDELLRSRAQQAADKARRLAEQKQAENDEIIFAMKHKAEMEAREQRESDEKTRKIMEFRSTLTAQMAEIERLRSISRSANGGEEGAATRAAAIKEEERLRVIRDKMVRDLEAQGVNPKYLSEMKHVAISKILLR